MARLGAERHAGLMELTAGFHRIEAEVAATDQNRQVGLMNRRKAMPPQRGMLFVFDHENNALHVDAQHAAAAVGGLHRRQGLHHQHRGHAAADRRQPLRPQAGALRAGNERSAGSPSAASSPVRSWAASTRRRVRTDETQQMAGTPC
jgi:hypothetical protein